MPTQLEVFNSALDLLGHEALTTVDDTTSVGAYLRRQWEFAFPEVLRAYPWNWAKRREELTEVSPAPDYGWEHKYVLPDDYVTLLKLNGETIFHESENYEIEGVNLYTDADTATVEYIAKPTDGSGSGIDADWTTEAMLSRADPLAVNALVTLLAAKIATKIAKDGAGLADALLNRYYANDLTRARFRNVNEAKKPGMFPQFTLSRWRNARRISTNG